MLTGAKPSGPGVGALFTTANHQLIRLAARVAALAADPDAQPADLAAAKAEYKQIAVRLGTMHAGFDSATAKPRH